MNNVTYCVINWSQRKCLELALKSYVKHHYQDTPLELMLVDQGSHDDSKQWLTENGVPFIDLPINISHEAAINAVFKKIHTRYCLLTDTDIEFTGSFDYYVNQLDQRTILAGDLITTDNLGTPMVPRIGAWQMLFDIAKVKQHGVMKFRDTSDHSYDTGSWMTSRIFDLGYKHLQIDRAPGDIDRDVIGMKYPRLNHLGKMSWATSHHKDRIDEIAMRMRYVEEQLPKYQNIELKGKFK